MTIALGSAAADLLVTVQRGSDKTFGLRLMDGAVNVSAGFAAVLTVRSGDGGEQEWLAELEDLDGSPALVWRISRTVTAALVGGGQGARLELVHVDSLDETTIGIGRVVAQ